MRSSLIGGTARRATRAAAVVLTVAGLTAAGLAQPATAGRPIGPVKGLTASISKPAGSPYRVSADWADLAGAVSYKVTLSTGAGAVLTSDTVTTSDWTVPTSRPVNTTVKVTVVPMSTRKGKPASITKTLPDLTAPTGVYDVSWTGVDATVSELSLSDDLSLPANISRELTWGEDGEDFAAWPSGSSAQHSYPLGDHRYVPQVRLTDEHNNQVVLDLHAIVIGDTAPPAGSFATSAPATVWARFTPVTVNQAELTDDFSPANKIVRAVDWGDGTVPTPWTSGLSITHVYQLGGTFTPKVALADETGNTTTADATEVVVAVDKLAPSLKLTVPKLGLKQVRSWKTLKGKVADAGVGMGKVRIRAVEKRGTTWYSYLPLKKVWVVGGSTRIKAMKLAGLARVAPAANGAWQFRLANLRKGTLVFQYSAADRVLNRTKLFVRSQVLTKF